MILLGFDVEEFDMPFEYGKSISFDEQLAISTTGTLTILQLLNKHGIKATFYCTANYAIHRPDIIKQIITEGHEIASHGYYHSEFKPAHLRESKDVLEDIGGTTVSGFRMARMMPVDEQEIAGAGYTYNSSINPTWIPGRYNNLNKPRTWFYKQNVLQLPVSVSPVIRFPLFWLSFHNLPLQLIKWMCAATLRTDGYLNLYFHPWEFTDLKNKEKFGFPGYVSKNSGGAFVNRINDFITWAKAKNYPFVTTANFVQQVKSGS